jgi:hypothetical protein
MKLWRITQRQAMAGPGSRQSFRNMPGQSSQPGDDQAGMRVIRLSGGVNRSVTAVPVLHLAIQTSELSIVLNQPFGLGGALHEEPLYADTEPIWSQQFSTSISIARASITTFVLSSTLCATRDYRLRVEAGNRELGSRKGSPETATTASIASSGRSFSVRNGLVAFSSGEPFGPDCTVL